MWAAGRKQRNKVTGVTHLLRLSGTGVLCMTTSPERRDTGDKNVPVNSQERKTSAASKPLFKQEKKQTEKRKRKKQSTNVLKRVSLMATSRRRRSVEQDQISG